MPEKEKQNLNSEIQTAPGLVCPETSTWGG